MNFFDYLFCRLYWCVIKRSIIPVVSGIFFLSAFQTYTVMPIYVSLHIFNICRDDLALFNMNPFLLVNTVILIADYFYFKYKTDRYKVLLKKFDKMKKNVKIKSDILCIIYIVMIIISNVIVFIVYRTQYISSHQI
jgi:hypothetical protein